MAHYQLYYIFTTPQQDLRLGGTDDVHALSGSITWSKDAAGRSVPTTTLRFKRKLITGDRFDAVINASGPISIVYAWAQGTPGDLRFHGDNHNHVMETAYDCQRPGCSLLSLTLPCSSACPAGFGNRHYIGYVSAQDYLQAGACA